MEKQMMETENQGTQTVYIVESKEGKAIATLIMGILSLFVPVVGLVPAVIAIIMGNGIVKHINEHGGDGRGMANAGRVLGWITVALTILTIILFVLGFGFLGSFLSFLF